MENHLLEVIIGLAAGKNMVETQVGQWIPPWHNGILDTEKIFEKIELMISMGSLTFNLVIASKIK